MKWSFYSNSALPKGIVDTWQSVNRDLAANNPALDHNFLRLLAKYFGDGDELLALCVDDGKYVAGIIIKSLRFGVWTVFSPGQSCMCAFVVSPRSDLFQVTSTLIDALPGYCWLLKFPKLDPACQRVKELSNFEIVEAVYYGTTYSVDLKSEFDDYWARRSKGLRANLRKRIAAVKRKGITLNMHFCTESKCVKEYIAVHGRLESSGWKGAAGTAIHADNEQGAFYSDLLASFAHTGGVIVAQLYFDNEPAASLLCIEKNGTVVVLKITYQERYSTLGPGRMLDYYFLRHCCEVGRFRVVEMHTRASKSDLSWATETRDIYNVNLYRFKFLKTLIRLIRNARQCLYYGLKRIYQVGGKVTAVIRRQP